MNPFLKTSSEAAMQQLEALQKAYKKPANLFPANDDVSEKYHAKYYRADDDEAANE